ncbi:DUF4381 domain-containing protein [Rhodopirellula sallentina]|uniref:DUF4381 domain-containing protein n=1 Tax=Rhodopirellula sallentina SM41 TaxID=1263870 RepID=M5TUU2_9BACT|nr:DUF4381 domain-containing protein [Rhodopirellula sallentina]EMI52935.1 hypothetical protein RSSM_05662 [Rhodopirellula sallentina SM41]
MMLDASSLDQLRDVAVPPPVSWWPLAPGWWVLIAVVVAGVVFGVLKWRRHWLADAYRRDALEAVDRASTDAAIVQILKRTAIGADTRSHVGSLTGRRWCDWLSATGDASMTDETAERITVGVYRDGNRRTPELADFAKRWIRTHRMNPSQPESPQQAGGR